MLETQTSLTGFTLINGTTSLQIALLVGCIYNVWLYPIDQITPYLHIDT